MDSLRYLYIKIKSKLNKDTVILAVDVANKSTMTFKNGSVIEYREIENSDVVRGKRRDVITYYDEPEFDKKQIEEILNSYIKNNN